MEWATNYRFKFCESKFKSRFENSLITVMVGGLHIEIMKRIFNEGHLGQYVIVFPKSDLIIVRLGHKKVQKMRLLY